MDSREAFEAWWYGAMSYSRLSEDLAWEAWQASRAALEVELPQAYELPPVMNHEELVTACREQDRAAIEAAGVSVKP